MSRASPPVPSWLWWSPVLLFGVPCALVLALDANPPLFAAWRGAGLALGPVFWSSATLAGDALVSPLFIVPFLPRRPALAWQGVLASICATAFTHLLKPMLDMPRPPAVLAGLAVTGPRLLAGSFPSGHTTSAFTVCALLVLAGAVRGALPVAAAVLLAGVVGLSRIMVGAHWPADVLAGAAGGWACAALGLRLAQRWPWGAGRMPRTLWQGLLALLAVVDLVGHDTGYPDGMALQRTLAAAALAALVWQQVRAARVAG